MEVGTLKANGEHTRSEMSGQIRTLQVNLQIVLKPNLGQGGPQAPSHHVMARVPGGDLVNVGAAWTKEAVRGENPGQKFLTITLDDESFARPMNLAAFQSKDDLRLWTITWKRRQAPTDTRAEARA